MGQHEILRFFYDKYKLDSKRFYTCSEVFEEFKDDVTKRTVQQNIRSLFNIGFLRFNGNEYIDGFFTGKNVTPKYSLSPTRANSAALMLGEKITLFKNPK